MPIQVGTVDGLINITDKIKTCFVEAIDKFDKEVFSKGIIDDLAIALGDAFQRYTYPVYSGNATEYTIKSLNNEVTTKTGNKQSPAYVTYCKKMGLLKTDGTTCFELTPLGRALKDGDILLKEYALLYMSKQGVFVDGVYRGNLLVDVAEFFNKYSYITTELLSEYIAQKYNKSDFSKTRFDIIIGALSAANLLTKVGNANTYVLSGIYPASVLRYLYDNREKISAACLDSDDAYSYYIGNFENGLLDVLNSSSVELIKDEYPNLTKYIHSTSKRSNILLTKSSHFSYLAALRTKPFMLLAGISGTGKSRIVRELAFKSCPPELQDEDATTPGNYLMVEVKPNWHDSTEILGYYSNIAGQYQYTKFVKFLVKAMMFPNVPFFVCLDEMNLAPVEQYFAEFLSVLETRKKGENGITTGVLVGPEAFASIRNAEAGNGYVAKYLCPELNINIPYHIYKNPSLAKVGLTLPDNVFIIGTVNMDDTTHQFSRKVIDRAMTIEMNGEDLNQMFGGSCALQYLPEDQIMPLSEFQPKYVNADEVMEEHPEAAETLQTELVAKLEAINACLKNTPFQVSYRVLNEMCIYAGVMLDSGKDVDEAIAAAVDQITLMKILPRIEGDEDMFVADNENKLMQLQKCFAEKSASYKKLEEMITRLKSSSFTRFWP
ncbi:MAG: hypothetical protein IIU55_01300 [Paludibacteraceae bacterium]|nr:hypothetical protein [Paludibacteraceae bacterium]